jgi:hypothetical protein
MYMLMNKEKDRVLLEEGKLSGKLYAKRSFFEPLLYRNWIVAYILSKVTGLVCIPIKFHDLSTQKGFIALHKRNYHYEWLRLKKDGTIHKIFIKGSAPFTLNTVDEDGYVCIVGLGKFPLGNFELVEF